MHFFRSVSYLVWDQLALGPSQCCLDHLLFSPLMRILAFEATLSALAFVGEVDLPLAVALE